MTPPRSLDTAIAGGVRRHRAAWDEALDGWRCCCGYKFATMTAAELHQAAAVRRVVCDWLREDEGAVEAAAKAYYEWATMNEGETSRWAEAGPHQAFARARAEVMRAALLAYMDWGDG